MKKIIKSLILTAMLAFCMSANAEYRSVNIDGMIDGIPVEIQNNTTSPIVKNSVKDNNTKLYGVVGKSQVLNFDLGIKRVSIADPTIADVVVISPRQLIINGKKAGNTSLIFWGKNSSSPVFYNLTVQNDADSFLEAVNYIAPNEDITIIFNNQGAVMSGFVSSTSVREQILNLAKSYGINLTDLTESPSKQVLLEVKITEVSKNFSRDLGVSFGYGKNAGGLNDYILKWVEKNPLVNLSQIFSDSGFSYYAFDKSSKFSAAINAAEQKGNIKILAKPKLLAVNNEEASFNVGNQVPIPSEVSESGNVSYQLKQTGVILKFKPTIMEKTGRVRLKLTPEVSEIDQSSSIIVSSATSNNVFATIPGFKTRKVDTTVELMDGETLVIAGLLTNNGTKNTSQVPGLGNIPVLGVLFKNTKNVTNDSELVIFITPKIVDTMNQAENI